MMGYGYHLTSAPRSVPPAPESAPAPCKECPSRGGKGNYCRIFKTFLADAVRGGDTIDPDTSRHLADNGACPKANRFYADKKLDEMPTPDYVKEPCLRCPNRCGKSGGFCKVEHTDKDGKPFKSHVGKAIWYCNEDEGAVQWRRNQNKKQEKEHAQKNQGQGKFTYQTADPGTDPTHILTLTKYGMKKKQRCFVDDLGWDEERVVMRRWKVYKLSESKSGKAYKVTARFDTTPHSLCHICGRTLTNPVSVITGIGPICGARVGVTAKDEREAMTQLEKYSDEVGFFSTYVPKGWVEDLTPWTADNTPDPRD